MFGISFFEILIIAILALIIIGPKELPELTHNIIRIVIKIKKFIAKTLEESGIKEIKDEIEKEVTKVEEETSTIIDIYGNEHEVSGVDNLRDDKNKEELKAEIAKYNKINSDKNNKKK